MNELKLDEGRFVETLRALMAHSRELQNDPTRGITPREDLAADVVLSRLLPLSTETGGGPLRIERVAFVPGRSNLLVTLPASAPHPAGAVRAVSFAGAHFDVVPADAARWKFDPFVLGLDAKTGKLTGRGVSDCLGHVALLTEVLVALASPGAPRLCTDIHAVFIADEEAGTGVVGAEPLLKNGHLKRLANGPAFWLDCADMQPCIGSGGLAVFELTASGRAFHSGFPQRGVNAIELASDAMLFLQRAFYRRFPPTPEQERTYGYRNSSSLKPTVVRMAGADGASVNQIPCECTLLGDIRLTPFYRIEDAVAFVTEAAAELSGDGVRKLETGDRGPDAKYDGGSVQLRWRGSPIKGLACNLESPGYKVLCQATQEVVGHLEPLADTGALPLIADLANAGIDIQTFGFAVEDAYHSDDEWAFVSDFEKGFRVIMRIIDLLQQQQQ